MNPSDHNRIEQIFIDVITQPAEQREAFLDHACGGVVVIKSRVKELLAAHELAPDIVRVPSDDPAARGERIGQYIIKRVLASGGMGVVYEAVQEKPHRTVALKVMRTGIAARSALRRFEYESQVLARLRHPNIAQVYEAGTHRDPGPPPQTVPYFAMEYVPNALTLLEYADQQQLGTHERLELFVKVCDAVDHGHGRGIIHRDLKPANILVDSSGEPKIIDFGVARATDSDIAVTTLQTDVGQLIGTLQYMSPEQCEADPGDLDTRSDVYALGVIIYQLLTGQLPYDVRNTAIQEAARVIREETPTRPSTISRALRGDVETITLKALEKTRERRYRSAEALADDLRRYLQNEPIAARPPSLAYQSLRFAQRHRALVAGTAAVAIVFILGVVATGMALLESRRQAEGLRQVLAFQESQLRDIDVELMAVRLREDLEAEIRAAAKRAGLDEATTTDRVEGVQRALLGANLTNVSRRALERSIFDRTLRAVDEQFAGQPLVRARLLDTMSTTLIELGLADAAAGPQAEALAIRRRALDDRDPDRLRSINNMGVILQSQGRLDEAEPYFREALQIRRRVLGDDHMDTLTSATNMGLLLQNQGRLDEAEPHLREALAGFRRIGGEEDLDTLIAVNNMGYLLRSQGKLDEAEAYYREALDARRRLLGDEHPATLTSINNMGFLLLSQGRLDDAEPYLHEALAGRRHVLGDVHRDTLSSINNMGFLRQSRGAFHEAERYYRETLAGRRQVLGDLHPETLGSITSLGFTLERQGRWGDTEPYYREALDGYREVFGRDNTLTLASMGRLAGLQERRGDLDDAVLHYRDAIDGYLRIGEEDDRITLPLMSRLGVLLQRQGKLVEAEPYYRDVLDAYRRTLGEDHPRTVNATIHMGFLLRRQGRLDDAETYLRAALDACRRGDDMPLTLASMNNLGGLLNDRESYEDAIPLLRESVETGPVVLGADHWRVAEARSMLGDALAGQGAGDPQFAEAESLLLDAYAALEASLPETRRQQKLPAAIERNVRLYERWDKPEEAEAWRARLPGN